MECYRYLDYKNSEKAPEKLNYLDCLGNKKKIPKEIGL